MTSILDSLVGNYTDSEGEEEKPSSEDQKNVDSLPDRLKEIEVDSPGSGASPKSRTSPNKVSGLVSYQLPDADEAMSDEDRKSEPMELESEEEEKENGDQTSRADTHDKCHIMKELWLEGVQLPPEPQGSCSQELQEKIEDMWRRKIEKKQDLNFQIQSNKAFRNPSIYDKLILHLDIDELGTNFPASLYDGHLFGKESYYDELGKAQHAEMDKLGKSNEAKKKLGDANVKEALNTIQQRKSKWGPQGAAARPPVGVSIPGALASSTQSRTIPAFGALKKK